MVRLVCNMRMCVHMYINTLHMYIQKGKEMGIQENRTLGFDMYYV